MKRNIFVAFGGHEYEHNVSLNSSYHICKELETLNEYNIFN